MLTRPSLRALALASVCAVLPAGAFAQEAAQSSPAKAEAAPTATTPQQAEVPREDGALDDIVVTAQKRESSVQRTALAITAVSGEDLRSREVNSVESLAPSLPNVNFGKNVGFARVAIRGVGLDTTVIGQEGRVAYHTDGVYISRPSAAIASFFDVNRVEVVRGPQGTLYGRNATAGAINVITNDPEAGFHGYGKVTLGNYGLVTTDGAVTGGSDELSARLAFETVNRGGYGRNLNLNEDIDNEKTYALRGKIKFKPNAHFDIVVSADYSHENDQAFVYHYIGAGSPGVLPLGQVLGGTVPANPRDTNSDVPQYNRRNFYGFGAVANLDLGFATLTSVTGYRHSDTDYRSDADGTSAVTATFHIEERAHQFSQELRLAGTVGHLRYLIGGYYFSEDIYGNNAFTPLRRPAPPYGFAQGVDFRGDSTTRASAAFGQLDWEIVPNLTLSAGARYNHERKGIDHRGMQDLVTPYDPTVPFVYTQFQVAKETENSFTPRFGIEFRASHDVLLYATYAKGFKSGGFNNNAFGNPLEPEKLTDYEGGIKAEFFDHKLRTNLAAFYYDYANLQLQRIIGSAAIPLNAGKAIVKGLEAELAVRPVRNLELSANASYLDSEIRNFSTPDAARPTLGNIVIDGNRLPQSPRYTVNLAAAYTIVSPIGDFTLRGEAAWTDRVYFSFYNRPEVSQPAYGKYNAFLNYANDKTGITASLFIRNIANKRTISSAQVSAGFSRFPIVGAYDPPRTYGVSLGYHF